MRRSCGLCEDPQVCSAAEELQHKQEIFHSSYSKTSFTLQVLWLSSKSHLDCSPKDSWISHICRKWNTWNEKCLFLCECNCWHLWWTQPCWAGIMCGGEGVIQRTEAHRQSLSALHLNLNTPPHTHTSSPLVPLCPQLKPSPQSYPSLLHLTLTPIQQSRLILHPSTHKHTHTQQTLVYAAWQHKLCSGDADWSSDGNIQRMKVCCCL